MDGGDSAPGSAWLGQLIDDGHGAALRYDLQRLGLDLADVWRGTLAPRRVLDLVEQSEHDTALGAALRGGPQYRGWNVQAYLAACLIDAVQNVSWTTAQVRSKKRLRHPTAFPRPMPGVAVKGKGRALDLSKHPDARPLPAKYLNRKAITKGG